METNNPSLEPATMDDTSQQLPDSVTYAVSYGEEGMLAFAALKAPQMVVNRESRRASCQWCQATSATRNDEMLTIGLYSTTYTVGTHFEK